MLRACGSAVLAAAFPELGIGLVGVAFAFGLTVLTGAYPLGPVSGGYFSPVAITVIATNLYWTCGETLFEFRIHPCRIATVFKVVNPYSASNPFSRPCPLDLTPPNGSSTPPPAP